MKKIILINNQKFLLTSVLSMKKFVNLLGFHSTKNGWEKHVSSVNVTLDQFNEIQLVESKAKQAIIQIDQNPELSKTPTDVLVFIENNLEWLEKETEIPLERISVILRKLKN